jgi:hypothetical protein
MASRTESSMIQRGVESSLAYAGSALSLMSASSVLVRRFTTGPENEDGRLPNTYPLTPVFWWVARTCLEDLPEGVLAEHRSDVKSPTPVKPWAPKDLPMAGINAVPVDALRQGNGGLPVVYWPFDNRLLVAKIPDRHLEGLPPGSDFLFRMKFEGLGQFGAGNAYPGRYIGAVAVQAVESIPASQAQAGMPSY